MYEKYRIAQKTIDELCSGINTEVSDNDKRVMILQLIAAPSYEKIEQAKERISSGEDFESVAKEVSRFSQIEYQVSRGTLNPILEKTAIYMSDGEVSDIIQTEQNYYLIRCVDDFDEVLSSENESQVLRKASLCNMVTKFYVICKGTYCWYFRGDLGKSAFLSDNSLYIR